MTNKLPSNPDDVKAHKKFLLNTLGLKKPIGSKKKKKEKKKKNNKPIIGELTAAQIARREKVTGPELSDPSEDAYNRYNTSQKDLDEVNKNKPKGSFIKGSLRKSHGGSVKRKAYANGGSVRDARY
jgi:hypothetical protein|tara:strand:+ start:4636 stop:5013 length:378 start_codon:yes stop_codon:yes gene_type:complete